jgi:hypothetical protein
MIKNIKDFIQHFLKKKLKGLLPEIKKLNIKSKLKLKQKLWLKQYKI